jgi:hypothetical protein
MNRMLRDEVTTCWRRMHENLCWALLTKHYFSSSSSLRPLELSLDFPHNRCLFCSVQSFCTHPNIITIIKLRQMRLAGHMTCMGKNTDAYREPERNSPLGTQAYMEGQY